MKSYCKNFKYDIAFVEKCIYECLSPYHGKKKWTRRDFAQLLSEYSDFSIQEIYQKSQCNESRIELYSAIHLMAIDFLHQIENRTINFKPIQYENRYDINSKKVRRIGISSIKQQIFDYIAVKSCQHMFDSKIGTYQCASIPNRGQIYGKHAIEKWIRKNPKQNRYVFKCDIKQYYPSVNQQKLKIFLHKDIKNTDVLYVLDVLIDTYDTGLSIGSYLSQYLANYYLSKAYHYLNEQCYYYRRGKRINMISHCLFYMDDILILGSNKTKLWKACKMLIIYLKDILGLEIKPNYQLFKLDSRPIDMMGYKIWTTHTALRRRIFLNARRAFIKYKISCKYMTEKDSKSITSYYGYFVHSDSQKIRKKYKLDKIKKEAVEVQRETAKRKL